MTRRRILNDSRQLRYRYHGGRISGCSPLHWSSRLNRACDRPITQSSAAFISWCVNGGPNGHATRQILVKFISNVLLDEALRPVTANGENFNYPTLVSVNAQVILATLGIQTNNSSPLVCVSFPPPEPPTIQYGRNSTVHYDHQRP
jgi:hypothetical protein